MKRNKKDKVYDFITTYSLELEHEEYPRFTTNFLSEKLGMQRTNLSSILNQLVKEGKLVKDNGRPVMYQYVNLSAQGEQVFEKLIGYDHSLKEAVAVAKAAALYPKGRASILITAKRGCGTRYFAETVFRFAVKSGVIKSRNALLSFDCKAYRENPDYRQKILFGTEKEIGLLQQSKEGMLLIENMNMLPDYERRQLLSSKERGIIICRIYPETEEEIYGSLKENTEFEIRLPSLKERPLEERFQLIRKFFSEEVSYIEKNLEMQVEVLKALLLYEGRDDISGLQKDIHTGCVNCYARKGHGQSKFIEILLSDFPPYVRKGLIYYKVRQEEIDQIISERYTYAFTALTMLKKQARPKEVEKQSDIYQSIDLRKKQYKKQEISEEETDLYVSAGLKEDFQEYYRGLEEKISDRKVLEKIISDKLINLTEHFLMEAGKELETVYSEKLLCALCMHINGALLRNGTKQRVSNEEILRMTRAYPEEHRLAKTFIEELEQKFQTKMNVDELIFIMLFLLQEKEEKKQEVVTLIAMHGDHSAEAVVRTVNALSDENNTYAFNLSLEKNMKEAYEELKQRIVDIHQGKGILFIYDMGSLRTMAESISVETDIQIRFVEAPITLLGVACSQKAKTTDDLDDIYEYLQKNFRNAAYVRNYDGATKIMVIISDEEKEAEKIQTFIQENMDWNNVRLRKIVTTSEGYLYNTLAGIADEGEIVGIVGRYDPLLSQYRFIDAERLLQAKRAGLEEYLQAQEKMDDIGVQETYEYLKENFPDLDMDKVQIQMNAFMQQMEYLMEVKLDEDKKIGLIIHIVCLLDNIRKSYTPSVSFIASTIIEKNKELVQEVKKILEPMEKEFDVYINDTEIAAIISIIRE